MTEVSENILLHDLFGRAAHEKRLSNMADGCKLFVSLLIGLCTICKHQAFFSAAFFMSVVPGDYVGRRRNIITLLSAVVFKTGGKR